MRLAQKFIHVCINLLPLLAVPALAQEPLDQRLKVAAGQALERSYGESIQQELRQIETASGPSALAYVLFKADQRTMAAVVKELSFPDRMDLINYQVQLLTEASAERSFDGFGANHTQQILEHARQVALFMIDELSTVEDWKTLAPSVESIRAYARQISIIPTTRMIPVRREDSGLGDSLLVTGHYLSNSSLTLLGLAVRGLQSDFVHKKVPDPEASEELRAVALKVDSELGLRLKFSAENLDLGLFARGMARAQSVCERLLN